MAIRKTKCVLKCIKWRLTNLLRALVLELVESKEFVLLSPRARKRNCHWEQCGGEKHAHEIYIILKEYKQCGINV